MYRWILSLFNTYFAPFTKEQEEKFEKDILSYVKYGNKEGIRILQKTIKPSFHTYILQESLQLNNLDFFKFMETSFKIKTYNAFNLLEEVNIQTLDYDLFVYLAENNKQYSTLDIYAFIKRVKNIREDIFKYMIGIFMLSYHIDNISEDDY